MDVQEVSVSIPISVSESLDHPETFVVDGNEYHVEPDVVGKIVGGKDGRYFFNQSKGFAGRTFVLITFSGRRIVTRNLWMGDRTDAPDTATFESHAPRPVLLRGFRYSWER